jgi:Na+-translocating ferredoxin:NAD+ oxidoreductase RNF subunit RnfB
MSILVIVFSILAMSIVSYFLGLGLVYASKKFAVHKDERIELIENALPQSNCGACGVPGGCGGYASGIVKDGLDINLCKPGGSATVQLIAKIIGLDVDSEMIREDSRVHCKSGQSQGLFKYEYNGIDDCIQAKMLYGGPKVCEYGCIGLGSCVRSCPFDAIRISKDRLISIIEDKCTACGRCVDICPQKIIHLVPTSMKLYMGCSSKDKGAVVRKVCHVGCIGCMRCEKACPVDAIHVVDNLAVFDYSKCINCNKCFEVCPTGCIKSSIKSEAKEAAAVAAGKNQSE